MAGRRHFGKNFCHDGLFHFETQNSTTHNELLDKFIFVQDKANQSILSVFIVDKERGRGSTFVKESVELFEGPSFAGGVKLVCFVKQSQG